MTRAFEDLFAVPDAFRNVPLPGRTDAWILSDAAAAHGVPPDQLSRFRDAYLARLPAELEKPGPRKGPMPGVRPLLDLLAARHDVFLALLTGNYEEAARLKLEYFDLWRYFRCGAFGDEAPDRHWLFAQALHRVSASRGSAVQPSDTVVVGDTPLDVACAAAGGARSVAVATGSHTAGELRAAGADAVLQDLSDMREVLRALRLAK